MKDDPVRRPTAIIALLVVGAVMVFVGVALMLGLQCGSNGLYTGLCPRAGCQPLPACPSLLDYIVSLALFSTGFMIAILGGTSILRTEMR